MIRQYRWMIVSGMVLFLLVLSVASGCGGGDSDAVDENADATVQVEQQEAADAREINRDDAINKVEITRAPEVDESGSETDLSNRIDSNNETPARKERKMVTPAKLPEVDSRPAAPALNLTDIAGHRVDNESLAGHAVLVVFWAAWCPPCKAEIPQLVKLQEKYRDDGLKILGLSIDKGGLPAVKKFVQARRNINYTIVPQGQDAARAFGRIAKIPTSILLDKQGRELKRWVGLVGEAELESWVVGALRETE